METERFRNWLFRQNFKKSTIDNRISICNRIERNKIDLDDEFNSDNGFRLLSDFTYSKKEKLNHIVPKHNIFIDGDILIGTATLKHSANLYFLFRQYLNREILLPDKLKKQLEEIENNKVIDDEEKKVLVKYRLGQSVYRKRLLEYWEGCSVCGCNFNEALIASHIKPWAQSDKHEKTDLYNGLLLSPNYDRLFDRNLISFDDKGFIIISNLLTDKNLTELNVSKKARLNPDKLTTDHLSYLKIHRENLRQIKTAGHNVLIP